MEQANKQFQVLLAQQLQSNQNQPPRPLNANTNVANLNTAIDQGNVKVTSLMEQNAMCAFILLILLFFGNSLNYFRVFHGWWSNSDRQHLDEEVVRLTEKLERTESEYDHVKEQYLEMEQKVVFVISITYGA